MMTMKPYYRSLLSALLFAGVIAVFLACSGLNEEKQDKNKGGGADNSVSISQNDSTAAIIDPTATTVQVVEGEAGTDLEGTRLEIPPGSLDGATPTSEVKVTHGIDVATDVTASYLTMPGPVVPASTSADISSDSGVSVAQDLYITLPITVDPNLYSIQLNDPTAHMAVFYVREHGLGLAAETGALPGSSIAVAADFSSVRFPISFFGMFQVGFVSEPVLAPVAKGGTPDFSSSNDSSGTATSGTSSTGSSTTAGDDNGGDESGDDGNNDDGGDDTSGDAGSGDAGSGDAGAGGESPDLLLHYLPSGLPGPVSEPITSWTDEGAVGGAQPASSLPGFTASDPTVRMEVINMDGALTATKVADFDPIDSCLGHSASHTGNLTLQIAFGVDGSLDTAAEGDKIMLFSMPGNDGENKRFSVWLFIEGGDARLAVASGVTEFDLFSYGESSGLGPYLNEGGLSNVLTIAIDTSVDIAAGQVYAAQLNGTPLGLADGVSSNAILETAPVGGTLGCWTDTGNTGNDSLNGWIGELKLWPAKLDDPAIYSQANALETRWGIP